MSEGDAKGVCVVCAWCVCVVCVLCVCGVCVCVVGGVGGVCVCGVCVCGVCVFYKLTLRVLDEQLISALDLLKKSR